MPQSNPLETPWLVIENSTQPGEQITIGSGADKYALVFTRAESIAAFIADLNDPALLAARLENWVLKEAFLSANAFVGATRVLFDYQRGQHQAISASLEQVLALVQARMLPGGSALG